MNVSSPMHDDIWHSENHQPYLVEAGSNVTLTCTAKSPRGFSSQPYEINWLVNSTIRQEKYDCRNRKRSPVVTCNLTLRWPAVGGNYTCQATNSKGCTFKVLELEVAGESRLIQVNNYYYYYYYHYYYYYYHYKRADGDKFCLYRFTTVARKYHEKARKRSVMRKEKLS